MPSATASNVFFRLQNTASRQCARGLFRHEGISQEPCFSGSRSSLLISEGYRHKRMTAWSVHPQRPMPRGSKAKYSDKQKRKAEHIEESYEKKGASKKTAAKRAWQTVNKQSGGGEKSGTGRKATPTAKKAARKESGQRAAASRKVGSRKVQKTPTRKKASASAK